MKKIPVWVLVIAGLFVLAPIASSIMGYIDPTFQFPEYDAAALPLAGSRLNKATVITKAVANLRERYMPNGPARESAAVLYPSNWKFGSIYWIITDARGAIAQKPAITNTQMGIFFIAISFYLHYFFHSRYISRYNQKNENKPGRNFIPLEKKF